MKKLLTILSAALLWTALPLTAQTAAPSPAPAAAPVADPAAPAPKPEAKLVFCDDETQVTVKDKKNTVIPATMGMNLLPGYTVSTLKSVAEIKLLPNGSIIKMVPNTTLTIEGLQGLDRSPSNDFALATGKIRVVAAKLAGIKPAYSIRTPAAVAGVRGTDFALMAVPGAKDWICVAEGAVNYAKSTGEAVMVKAGEFADIFANTFASMPAPQSQFQQIFGDLSFKGLNVLDVPGHTVDSVAQAVGDTAPPAEPPKPAAETKPEAKPAAPQASNNEFLKNLGFEVGAITIDGKTYSKAVIQPNLNFDNVKIGLYLPVVYTKDIMDPATWYKPAGNNEWSFGTDASFGNDWIARSLDFLSDAALKIKYVEIGRPAFDPWFLKIGNLKTMTIGHGSLMLDYANDEEFPAVRKIGFNAGLTLAPVGLQAVIDDLAKPDVVGGRLAFQIIPDMTEIGLSSIVDLDPAAKADASSGITGSPLLINAGVDLQLAKLDLGILKTILFADAGTWLPYYRTAMAGYNGFVLDTFIKNGQLKNWGLVAGGYGNILIMDYRLEFRFNKGIYENTLFKADYNRTKLTTVKQIQDYLQGNLPNADQATVLGIYGSAGFKILELAEFSGAYLWPMTLTDGGIDTSSDDFLRLKFEIFKDKLPILPLSGLVAYERTKFAKTIGEMWNGGGKGLYLFDANTVLKGELVYGLAPTLDLVVGVSTNVARDANGNVLYQADNLTPKIAPSINIETRIHF